MKQSISQHSGEQGQVSSSSRSQQLAEFKRKSMRKTHAYMPYIQVTLPHQGGVASGTRPRTSSQVPGIPESLTVALIASPLP